VKAVSIRFGGARRFRRRAGSDRGSAIIEFVFVAVLVMVPLIYFMVAVASVQRAQQTLTTAARESGRAFATAQTVPQGLARAAVAAQIAFTDAGLADAPRLAFVASGSTCDSTPVRPTLDAGAQFTICMRRQSELPAIPTLLQGRGVRTEARYSVHIDDFRSSR
jgi:Flp pilus assembly protein TadG